MQSIVVAELPNGIGAPATRTVALTENIPLLAKGISIFEESHFVFPAKTPLLSRGGADATHQENIAKHPFMERTGWCCSMGPRNQTLGQHHYYGFALSRSRFAPVCAAKVASRLLF